jgi:hypothetical protein
MRPAGSETGPNHLTQAAKRLPHYLLTSRCRGVIPGLLAMPAYRRLERPVQFRPIVQRMVENIPVGWREVEVPACIDAALCCRQALTTTKSVMPGLLIGGCSRKLALHARISWQKPCNRP